MDVRTEMLVIFCEGLTKVFAPGRPPGYPRGRPRDIRPQNLLFGLPSILPLEIEFFPISRGLTGKNLFDTGLSFVGMPIVIQCRYWEELRSPYLPSGPEETS